MTVFPEPVLISHEHFDDFDWTQLPPIQDATAPRPYLAGFVDKLRDTEFAHCSFYRGRWGVGMNRVRFHHCDFIECDFAGLTINLGSLHDSSFHRCDFRAGSRVSRTRTILTTRDCSFFACKFPVLRFRNAEGRYTIFTKQMLRATTLQPPILTSDCKIVCIRIYDAVVISGQPMSHESDWRPDVLTPEDYYARNRSRRRR